MQYEVEQRGVEQAATVRGLVEVRNDATLYHDVTISGCLRHNHQLCSYSTPTVIPIDAVSASTLSTSAIERHPFLVATRTQPW